MTITSRPLILLLVLCVIAVGLVLVMDSPADAHTPSCKSRYPWFRYRLVPVFGIPDLFIAYFYNASTGSTHTHGCYAWQL